MTFRPQRGELKMRFGLKRTAACASHASRLVKCDVSKMRLGPFGSGAASAFPSVPPTKSGEIAHFKSDRPTRWRFVAEASSQIPGKGSGHGSHLRAGSPPADAQGSVRFAHRTLSLHATLPEVPVWNKHKRRRACAEAVEFVPFLWKGKEKQAEIGNLHRVRVKKATDCTDEHGCEIRGDPC